MELNQLRYFLAVAETEHVTNSAKMLHISQPSLTQSLRKLESELGMQLFERVGRGVRLTSAGRHLQTFAQIAVNDFDAIAPEMKEFIKSQANLIRVTVEDAASLTADLIVAYRTEHPDVEFRIIQRSVGNAAPNPASSELAGLVFDTRFPSVSKSTLDIQPLFSLIERVCLAVPISSSFGESVALEELEACPMVRLSPAYRFRLDCDRVCAKHGIHTNLVFESESPLVSQKIISVGLGVGFWGEVSWPKLDPDKARLASIQCDDFKQEIIIGTRIEADLTPAERSFLAFCEKHLMR